MKSKTRLLAVDDDEINRDVYEVLLGEDYDLHLAESGEHALEVAEKIRPDVILLDIMMPGINGYETCGRLRKSPVLRFAKVILVSAKATLAERLQGYEAGADDYITKPFDHDELRAKVSVFVRLKAAEEVNVLKTNVLELLCHETRTPLNAILAPADMIENDPDMDYAERKSWAGLIKEGGERLLRLFEKVLQLSQYKAGHRTADPEVLDLAGLVREILEESDARIRDKELGVETDLSSEARVFGGRHECLQIVRTLVDNAVEFSTDQGEVTISLEVTESGSLLEVTNVGQGIPEDQLPTVFEPFPPGERRGAGLSLALAREMVGSHGGEITAASADGRTTFSVCWPPPGQGEPEALA